MSSKYCPENCPVEVSILVRSSSGIIGYGNVPDQPVAVYDENNPKHAKMLADVLEYYLHDDFDDGNPRVAHMYAVRKYRIPEWVSAEEFVENFDSWGHYVVGRPGVDIDDVDYVGHSYWVHHFGQNVKRFGDLSQDCISVMYDLFDKNLRSAFKKSCKAQVEAWLRGEGKYASPLSGNQVAALSRRYY
jgi:hypothetical protein